MDKIEYMQNMCQRLLENNELMEVFIFTVDLFAGYIYLYYAILTLYFIFSAIREFAQTHSYYRNIKQIMRRFEMQGILGIEITYHEGEFYITYLDIEICKRDLLKGMLFLQELLYYKDLYQPPKHIKAGIKFHWFVNDIKDKIGLNKRPKP